MIETMVILFLSNFATCSVADSIWDRYNPKYAFLFQDNNARNIGDVITVLLEENTIVQEQEKRDYNKSNNAIGNLNIGTSNRPGQLGQVDSSYTFAGNYGANINRVFNDRMSAVVVDILPNNNLVIEGYRKRIISGEEKIIRIVGIVRPADIKAGNIVTSDKVANLRIYYMGRGSSNNITKPSLFYRLMQYIWPW